jgi:hypothetical protein
MKRSLIAAGICCILAVAAAFAQEKKSAVIDLTKYFNHKPGEKLEGDERSGNELPVPKGEQEFKGIKMQIGERVIQLGSKTVGDKPEKVEGIKVDRKFAKLHILHATAFGGGPNVEGTPGHVEDDTLIGEYRINYDDKSSENITIEYGKDVRDWWFREDEKETSRAKVAWTGDNDLAKQYSCRLRLYLTTWKNPKPDKKIVSIDFIGRKEETAAAPFCLAMTAEDE